MRLDKYLVERFNISRDTAIEIIKNGNCLINGVEAQKQGQKVSQSDQITLKENSLPKYVSRAGDKLEQALCEFKINPKGLNCLDVGSSTGGFTDCLLQHDAKHITAVDVGTDQFSAKLKNNPRVTLLEQTDIRDFHAPNTYDLITCDVSFISSFKILPTLTRFANQETNLVLLYKPQYEHNQPLDSALDKFGATKWQLISSTLSSKRGKNNQREWLCFLKITSP